MKVKVESEKVGLKLNVQETKIMASGPITSWEIDGETVETVHLCMWVIYWGLLLRLPCRRYGGGAPAWVAGVLKAPGTQGSWWLGQQEIQRSRRVRQPLMANTLQYSCLENLPGRKAWQATVHRVIKSWTLPK